MNTDTPQDDLLRRYLLGQSSEEESSALEAEFLANDQFFDEMVAREDELFYEYRGNEMDAAERSAFETRFLRARDGRERAAFAGAFLEAAKGLATEENTAPRAIIEDKPAGVFAAIAAFFGLSGTAMQFGMAAAMILLVLGLGFVAIQNINLRREMAALDSERARERQEQERIINDKQAREADIERQLADERSQASQNESRIAEIEAERTKLRSEIDEAKRKADQLRQPPSKQPQSDSSSRSILALALSPGHFVRSDGVDMSRIKLSPAVTSVSVDLTLKNVSDYPKFRAIVRKVDDGSQVYAGPIMAARSIAGVKHLNVSIPATRLIRADYEIVLMGMKPDLSFEEITSYYFSVTR